VNRAFIGRPRAGKTFGLQQAARHAVETSPWSVLVLDGNREWLVPEVWRGSRVRVARVRSADAARAKLAEGVRVVLVDAELVAGSMDDDAPFAAIGNELARVAVESGPTILVLPEAHWVVREGRKLPTYVGLIAHQSRWRGAYVWLDTQRPADVRKEMLDLCAEWYVYALPGSREYELMRREGGRELEAAARKISHLRESEGPGWHLRYTRSEDDARWAYRVNGARLERRRIG
jgi:hypothetical protein